MVVFVYGGGWKNGNKGIYRFVGAALAARGFLTVVPDYQVFPQVRFQRFFRITLLRSPGSKETLHGMVEIRSDLP